MAYKSNVNISGLALDALSNSLLSSNLSMRRECRIIYALRMLNYLCVENVEVELSMRRECELSTCRKFPKNLRKLEKSKKVACHHLENKFSAFSTFDVSSNGFSTHRLYISVSIYTGHCQP